MSLQDLTKGDLQYYRAYAGKMLSYHESHFMREIDPDLLRAFYRGYKTKEYREFLNDPLKRRNNTIALTRIFTATNTIEPNLYYQNPKIFAVPTRGTDPRRAALMTAVQNYYMRATKQKQENQTAIMNAYFFGIGWKKIGYHTAFPAPEDAMDQPEEQIDGDELMQIEKRIANPSDNLEARDIPQLPMTETLFNTSESPANVILDHKGTWRSFNVINHRLKRTLYDLKHFGNYNPDALQEVSSKMRYQGGSRFDDRDIEVTLNEMMIRQRNGIWILTFLDEAELPLKYERSLSKSDFPWKPIVLTNEPDVCYPISHMRVGGSIQEWVDRIATLQLEIIGKMRNQIAVWEDALSNGQDQALQANKIGGIIKFKKPVNAQAFAQLATNPVTFDLFNMLGITQQNLTEVMGADAQRIAGKSDNKTLGQDELASMGTQIRESGMLDKVREWIISQKEFEGEILQQYGTAEMYLTIAPEDFRKKQEADAIGGQPINMEFMTQAHPVPIRDYLRGHYDYELNIYEAVKPDKKVLAREYDEAMMVYSNPVISNAMLQMNKRVRIDIIAEKRGKMFEYVNADEFIETLDPMQTAQIQAMNVLQARNGELPPTQEQRMEEKQMDAELKASTKEA